MARRTHEETEHRGGARSLKARTFPFVWHWIMALGVVPAVATGLWLLGRGNPQARALIAFLDALATWALVTFTFKLADHAGRRPLIKWHAAGTVAGVGLTWGLTTISGWSLTWGLVYFFAACVGAGSWNAHRLDALRARADEKGDDKGLAEILGVPNARFGKPKVTLDTITARVTAEPGGTIADVQSALPKIEAAAQGAIPGRGRVVQDPDNAAAGELVISRRDALRTWQPWPGPSHLGGSIADPIVTGYYEDGAAQRYWFCAGTTDEGDPRVGTHMGRMGMSGSGKTGDAKIELAELMTRRDVVVFYADITKGAQTAKPLLRGITLYADTSPKGKILFRAVQRMIRDRADRLGHAGFADWVPACFEDPALRMPAVVYFVDEADELINHRLFEWLCGKARSAGVFLSVALPRADHTSMPPKARFNIGAWKCFGTGDDYSAEFALTEQTRKAGAHPENWRNTKPGVHFLDTAPGVDSRLFPVPCRTFRHTDVQVEDAVRAGDPYRATLPGYDMAALGDAWTYCQPADARRPGDPVPPTSEDDEGDGWDVDADEEEDVDALAQVLARSEGGEDGDRQMYASVDPTRPIPPMTGPDMQFGDDAPAPVSQAEAEAEFDRVLVELCAEPGRTVVTTAELTERFTLRGSSWRSRRLFAVADGAVVSPPGIKLTRDEHRAGVYHVHRLNGHGP